MQPSSYSMPLLRPVRYGNCPQRARFRFPLHAQPARIHNLLLALAPPGLGAALHSTRLVTTGSGAGGLRLLRLLEVVLGDPLLLVAAGTGRSDSANGRGDFRAGLALLGLGGEREVGVVASTAEDTSDDEVSQEAGTRARWSVEGATRR